MPAPHTSVWDHVASAYAPATDAGETDAQPQQPARPSIPRRLGALLREAVVARQRRSRALAAARFILAILGIAAAVAAAAAAGLAAPLLLQRLPAVPSVLRAAAAAVAFGAVALVIISLIGGHRRDQERSALGMRRGRLAPFRSRAADDPDAAHELASRRAFWRNELERNAWHASRKLVHADPLASLAWLLPSSVVALAIPAFFIGAGPLEMPFVLLLLCVLTGAFIVGHTREPMLRRRLRRSLSDYSCPDCTYDLLSTVASRDPNDLTPWHHPEHCPECGAPYPLIPAPIPARDARPSTVAHPS